MPAVIAFVTAYWKPLLAAIVIGLLTLLYNVHVNGLIKTAVDKAVVENNQAWQKSEQAAIAKAQSEAQATAEAHQKDLADIAAKHQKDLANAKLQHDKDVADARSGALRLRLAVASCAGSSSVQAPAGPASGGNDPSSAELSSEATGALYSLADDADAVSSQLSACQQVILSDRKAFPTAKGTP